MSAYILLGVFLIGAHLMATIALAFSVPAMIRNNTIKEGILILVISLATAIFIARQLWLA